MFILIYSKLIYAMCQPKKNEIDIYKDTENSDTDFVQITEACPDDRKQMVFTTTVYRKDVACFHVNSHIDV